jgi:hypothetical protein
VAVLRGVDVDCDDGDAVFRGVDPTGIVNPLRIRFSLGSVTMVALGDDIGSTLRGLNRWAWDLNCPCVIGFLDSLPCAAEGAGINVGSTIALGPLAGVGLILTAVVALGAGVPSGTSNRPRRCDAVGDVGGDEPGDKFGAEVGAGVGCCAIILENKRVRPTQPTK